MKYIYVYILIMNTSLYRSYKIDITRDLKKKDLKKD